MIGLITLRHGAQQSRHLRPHRLVQILARGTGVTAQYQWYTEQCWLGPMLGDKVRILTYTLPMHGGQIAGRSGCFRVRSGCTTCQTVLQRSDGQWLIDGTSRASCILQDKACYFKLSFKLSYKYVCYLI